MVIGQRTLSLVCLVAWVCLVILYPPWIGRIYPHGVFQLEREGPFDSDAPVWAPPKPSQPEMTKSQIRWPWQPVRQRYHVEVSVVKISTLLSFGVLVLGLILRGWTWITAPRKPDILVSVAWSISLSLVLAWICMIAIGLMSAGYALTDGVVITILSIGIIGGCIYGIIAFLHSCFVTSTQPIADNAPLQDTHSTSSLAACLTVGIARLRKAATGFMGFTIGVVFAFGLTMVVAWGASFFRGRELGVTVLGTSRYEHETSVNVIAGLMILAGAWILGLWMLRSRLPRGFPIGLIIASTALGILFAIH